LALRAEVEAVSGEELVPPRLEGLPFWNRRTAIALELALFAISALLMDVGRAIAVAIAGLFLCAAISFVSATRTNTPSGIACRRLSRKKVAMISIAVIFTFYLSGILAPVLPIPGYAHQDLNQALKPPSLSHPFGTDRIGRDQLSRCIWAAQTTVIVTVASFITGSLILGIGLGLLSGYAGGWVDSLVMRMGDLFAGLPTILLIILINATLKDRIHSLGRSVENFTGIGGIVKSGAPDYLLVFGAVSIFSWVGLARIIRSRVLSLRETEYVMAARAMGSSTTRILFRHLMPNVSNILLVTISASLAASAGSEIALTFFGVGIQPPHPSFGAMIFDGSGLRQLNAYPWLLLFPVGIISLFYFAFNLLGDALTDVFTPRAN
jgi:ABC-type dipeptide/oligopeptide/nickel transport system permease subunit